MPRVGTLLTAYLTHCNVPVLNDMVVVEKSHLLILQNCFTAAAVQCRLLR